MTLSKTLSSARLKARLSLYLNQFFSFSQLVLGFSHLPPKEFGLVEKVLCEDPSVLTHMWRTLDLMVCAL